MTETTLADTDWTAPLGGSAVLAADYDSHDQQLLRLYALGKQRQWNSDSRLDWSLPVDPDNPLGMPDSFVWIAGSELWDRLPPAEHSVLRRHAAAWASSQLLHGEQFSLVAVSKIAQSAPEADAKLFAATQIMDEARHTEVVNRLLTEKIGLRYGLTGSLAGLFDNVVRDARWDFCALGVQVVLENLALATLTVQRDRTRIPLIRSLTTYVMQDEARHVAFGRIMLRRTYRDLTSAELREREEFVVESCWSLREGFVGEAIWNTLDYGAQECIAIARTSPALRQYRRRLFMRIVPALRDIGLFGPAVRDALEKMGVLGFAELDESPADSLDALDAAAEELDRSERAARQAEIEQIAALGAAEAPEAPEDLEDLRTRQTREDPSDQEPRR
ncbi:hypothetical protein ABIA31_007387 [Catenulispora sp. MAP5-51]|uniref:ferritin-like domain-containing protein n=1 Tax=Catenulispora sp. MAP5-51 TaxID=3156298 RepID=UPI00351928B5